MKLQFYMNFIDLIKERTGVIGGFKTGSVINVTSLFADILNRDRLGSNGLR